MNLSNQIMQSRYKFLSEPIVANLLLIHRNNLGTCGPVFCNADLFFAARNRTHFLKYPPMGFALHALGTILNVLLPLHAIYVLRTYERFKVTVLRHNVTVPEVLFQSHLHNNDKGGTGKKLLLQCRSKIP